MGREVEENRAGTERKIMKAIRRRQIEFLGHVMRKEGLEDMMLIGRVNGKWSRGRQRFAYLESLSKWMTEQVDETEKSQVARLKILRTALWSPMFVENMAHREDDYYTSFFFNNICKIFTPYSSYILNFYST